MNARKFLEILPQLYNNFGESLMTPKSSEFQQVKQHIKGNTYLNIMQLLNAAEEAFLIISNSKIPEVTSAI